MTDVLELGDVAKDVVTGFKGVIVSDCIWLNNCRRLELQPQKLQDGQPQVPKCFDYDQLVLVEKAVVPHKGPRRTTGGDRAMPQRQLDQRR